LLRHRLARETVERIRLAGRAQSLRELDAADVPLTAAVGELDDVRATVLVNALAELAPERDPLVAVDRRIARDDSPAHVDRDERGDDRSHPGSGEAGLEVDPRTRSPTVVVVEAAGDARTEDAVAGREIPEGQRLEQPVGGHDCSRSGSSGHCGHVLR
jgi:hypothetical protein